MDGEEDPKYRKKPPASVRIARKLKKAPNAPHLIEITGQLVQSFGGVEPFVKEMYEQYQNCPPSQKGSWMRSFVKMVESATEMGGADKDLSQMSEEDLARELKRVLKY